MIACDTSSFIAYLQGDPGRDTDLIEEALMDAQLVFPPPVLAEIMSDPTLPKQAAQAIENTSIRNIRRILDPCGTTSIQNHRQKKKARLADALIAQNCLDAGVSLVTRDKDFKNFDGLKIISN